MAKVGLTPLGEALYRVEKILDEATKPDNFEKILKEIRNADTHSIRFIYGYAGALRAVRVKP